MIPKNINPALLPEFFGMVLRMAQDIGLSDKEACDLFSKNNIVEGYRIVRHDPPPP